MEINGHNYIQLQTSVYRVARDREREEESERAREKRYNSISVMRSEISLTVQKVVKCSPSVFLSRGKFQHIYYLEYPGPTIIKLNLRERLFDFYSVMAHWIIQD